MYDKGFWEKYVSKILQIFFASLRGLPVICLSVLPLQYSTDTPLGCRWKPSVSMIVLCKMQVHLIILSAVSILVSMHFKSIRHYAVIILNVHSMHFLERYKRLLKHSCSIHTFFPPKGFVDATKNDFSRFYRYSLCTIQPRENGADRRWLPVSGNLLPLCLYPKKWTSP